jgi:hypothetical protein
MMLGEIERFVGRLRDRPWIEPALVDVIAHGLRSAVCDPDQSLWDRLREVIRDEDDLVGHQLAEISIITGAHLRNEHQTRAGGAH